MRKIVPSYFMDMVSDSLLYHYQEFNHENKYQFPFELFDGLIDERELKEFYRDATILRTIYLNIYNVKFVSQLL